MTAYRPEQTEQHLRSELESARRELESIRGENRTLRSKKSFSPSMSIAGVIGVAMTSALAGVTALLWYARLTGYVSIDGWVMYFATVSALCGLVVSFVQTTKAGA